MGLAHPCIRNGRPSGRVPACEPLDVIGPRTLIDGLLELLVVPSFTRVGYRVRSRLFDWDGPEAWTLSRAGRSS